VREQEAMTIRLAMALLAVFALAPPAPARQDKRTYYTVQHPDQFAIDWAAFYDRAEVMTEKRIVFTWRPSRPLRSKVRRRSRRVTT
jgi:hypothetical protein